MKKRILIWFIAGLSLFAACQKPDEPVPTGVPEQVDTPTPVPVQKATPTASPTPEAVITVTQTPTRIPEQPASPTAVPKPEPSSTSTPTPTVSPVPLESVAPTATETPMPTKTPTPEPMVTQEPEPTALPSPSPTEIPEPTVTEQPLPMVSETPLPTPTEIPEPTATPTPTMAPELLVHGGWQKTESICGAYEVIFPDLFDEAELIQGQQELMVRYMDTQDPSVMFYIVYTMQQNGVQVLDDLYERNGIFISDNPGTEGVQYLLYEDGVMYHGILLEEQYPSSLIGDGFGNEEYIIGTMQAILAYPKNEDIYTTDKYSFYVVPKR